MFNEEAFNNREKYKESPLFIKATEILKLAHRIAEIAAQYEPENSNELDTEILRNHAFLIREDASRIPTKIAGAWGCDLYDLRMENATLTRKAARDLNTHMTSLEIYGFKETEYLVDIWGNPFHLNHENEGIFCECCSRIISRKITNGGYQLSDGRHICSLCDVSIIKTEEELQESFDNVRLPSNE